MEKYYKILEIENSATDEEVKKAYMNLKRKYDPNNYNKEDLKKHAQEKTKEITDAFDNIMNKRRAERIQDEKTEKNNKKFEEESLKNIENLIDENMLQRADSLLMEIEQEKRTARWYFLKGAILFKKGWLLEAQNFFSTAVNMDPSNEEYKSALEKAMWQQRGGFNTPQGSGGPFSGPYPTNSPMGCSMCDICGTIMCADMCCDCTTPHRFC